MLLPKIKTQTTTWIAVCMPFATLYNFVLEVGGADKSVLKFDQGVIRPHLIQKFNTFQKNILTLPDESRPSNYCGDYRRIIYIVLLLQFPKMLR